MNTYYLVPYDRIPADATSLWFVTWSTSQPAVAWSKTRPAIKPDGKSAWVVGIAVNTSPSGATLIGSGSKDVPPPPDALSYVGTTPTAADFEDAFRRYVAARSMPPPPG